MKSALRREQRTDLISSAKQISSAIADFILASARISLYNALEVITVAENKLADLSTDFAVKILKLTDGMKGHYSLVNQLERSATSIGAKIREAKYAHSKSDFVSKLQIALTECHEIEYWLELMQKAERLPKKSLRDICTTSVGYLFNWRRKI